MVRSRLLPIAGVAVLSIVLSACSHTPTSMRTRVQQWATDQSYGEAEANVTEDLAGIATGIRLGDLRGVRTDCIGFNTDIDQIYSSLPAPDGSVTNDLNLAITKYWAVGAQDCYDSKSFDSAKFKGFQRDLKSGKAIYDRAESILHGYGVA